MQDTFILIHRSSSWQCGADSLQLSNKHWLNEYSKGSVQIISVQSHNSGYKYNELDYPAE